jgi:hypothetical protein
MKNIPKKNIVALLLVFFAVSVGYYQRKSNTSDDDSKSLPVSQISLTSKEKNTHLRANETNHQTFAKKVNDSIMNVASGSIVDVGDINSAIQAAYLIDDDESRVQTLKGIAHLWTLKDPEACLKWALSITNDKIGYEYITAQVFLTLVGNDQSGKAIELLNEVHQGKLRDTAIAYGIWGMLDRESIDLAGAQQMLSLIGSKEQMDRSAGSLVKELVISNRLQDLKQMYDDLPFGMLKDSFGSSVLRNLVFKDPLSGLDWIRNNPEMNNTENYESLAAGFARLDPFQGIKVADEITDTAIKRRYLSNLLNGWAYNEPEEAGKWITDQISNVNFDQMKDEFFMIARKSLAHDQDLLFSQIENINDQGEKDLATLSAAAALSEYNPSRAAKLVLATLPGQPEKQADAVAITAKNWLIRDPLEASKWIGGLEVGPIKDAAVSELVTNILAKDKDIAMANSWAAQIRDSKVRAQVNARIDKTKP